MSVLIIIVLIYLPQKRDLGAISGNKYSGTVLSMWPKNRPLYYRQLAYISNDKHRIYYIFHIDLRWAGSAYFGPPPHDSTFGDIEPHTFIKKRIIGYCLFSHN